MKRRLSPVLAMLKVGVMGFGGGSALIPLIGDELVQRRKALTGRTFTQHVVVSSVTPGALPVKLGGLAGMQMSGAWLALVMALAVSLPGLLGTLALLSSIDAGGGAAVRYVELASVGITVFILVLLLHYTLSVVRDAHSRLTAVVILIVSALATGMGQAVELVGRLFGQSWSADWLPRMSTVQLIGVALLAIVVRALLRRERRATPAVTPDELTVRNSKVVRTAALAVGVAVAAVVVPMIVLGWNAGELLGLISISAMTSFGGGEAYVGVADGIFVGGGLISSSVFYGQLVPVANALPGPILIKLAAGIGFGAAEGPAAGWLLGISAGVLGIALCILVAVIVMAVFERMPNSPVVRDIGRYILPVICGLLVTTSISMLNAAGHIVDPLAVPSTAVLWVAIVAVAGVYWLRERHIVHDLVLILACGGVSLAVLTLFG